MGIATAAGRSTLRRAKVQLLATKALLDDDDYYDTLSDDDKVKAMLQSMQIGPEILRIENAQIALIVAKVEANAGALDAATGELKNARQELENLNRILSAVRDVLGLVARVLSPV